MYRVKAEKTKLRRACNAAIAVLVVAALAVLLWLAYLGATANAQEQGAASVRQTVLDTAMQCCAIEGSYPASLKYLEEHYGLAINRRDYIVTYEAFAGNIPPTVVVIAK